MAPEDHPSPPDLPPPPVLSQSWRRSNLATISVGVIAMVATFCSAVVAYHPTQLRASSARQQAAEEFRRTQEKDAYNASMTTVQKLDAAETELLPQNLTYPLETRRGRFTRAHKNGRRPIAILNELWRGSNLQGSKQIQVALEKLRYAHKEVIHAFIVVTSHLTDNEKRGASKVVADFEANRNTIAPENDLIIAAKADLGFSE